MQQPSNNITRKKPWNLIDTTVYSLATTNVDGEVNMNICTYVTAVSMQPKRMAIAVYNGTKSLENMLINSTAVLQILNNNQYNLVRLLGQQSGILINKYARLTKRKELLQWHNYNVLQNAIAVMEVKAIQQIDAGDHQLFICDVLRHQNFSNDSILTLQTLRHHKIIRI
jgi:flavin reductase (DIM6/NTAB) family NADH-FMN oxidoreductase RutF